MKSVIQLLLAFSLVFALFPQQTSGAAKPSFEQHILLQLNNVKDSKQVMIVEGSTQSFKAIVRTYEQKNGKWALKDRMTAVAGKNGMTADKREGDGKTPMGLYSFGEAFGYDKPPSGLKMRYTRTNHYHYWVDDSSSKDYNKWIYYKGNPSKKWKSYERMNHPLYTHALIIRYNDQPIIKGKGSAIFLHKWRSAGKPTAGCIAVNIQDLTSLLRWVNPQSKPKILIGTQSVILNELKAYEN